MARVVILGAGISGHTAALHLRRMLDKEHEVMVVSPNSQWNWIPSNIWVGVGKMTVKDVTFPLAPVYRRKGITYQQAKAVAVWPEGDQDDTRPGVDVVHTSPERQGETERIRYDYLVNATGPRLNFEATPGLGPDGNSWSVCTAGHAVETAEALNQVDREAARRRAAAAGHRHGPRGLHLRGRGVRVHLQRRAELRAAGVRDLAEIVYLSNEYDLGRLRGRRHGVRPGRVPVIEPDVDGVAVPRARCAGNRSAHTSSGSRTARCSTRRSTAATRASTFDFAMLLPPFRGAALTAYDVEGTDITDRLFAPSGFLKVDADYTPKPYEEWRAEDWPSTYQSPAYGNIFGVGIAFAPPHPISRPRTSPNGTVITPARPAPACPRASWAARSPAASATCIQNGATAPTPHRAP